MSYEEVIERIKKQEKWLDAELERDRELRDAGEIDGRIFMEPVADGYAYYRVTVREGGDTVRLDHLDLFDGYRIALIEQLDRILPIEAVRRSLEMRDEVDRLVEARA